MEIDVHAPAGLVVEARFDDFKVVTDQPANDGGTNSAPSPFDLFLASLATCAGYYVVAFCRERALPTEGLALKMTSDWNEKTHLVENICLDIALPDGFPEKYRRAVMRVAGMCTVKRHLETPPEFKITARNGHPV
jgi:ribosomal protein S12 methylthiotransferase accessory factor